MKYQDEKKSVCVEDMVAYRISDTEIQITWPDENNPYVKEYEVKRHIKGEDGWQTIGTLASDQKTEGRSLTISDKLKDSSIQQYEYRVDVSVSEEKEYEPSEGKAVWRAPQYMKQNRLWGILLTVSSSMQVTW